MHSRRALAAVDLASAGNACDDHQTVGVINGIDDAVVADADPEVVSPGQLHGAPRPRIDTERVDRRFDPVTERTLQAPVLAGRRRMEPDLVLGL